MKDIETSRCKLIDYLSIISDSGNKNKHFEIPEYQRKYEWGADSNKSCEKFLDDIKNAAMLGDNASSFFGTIILDCSCDDVFNLVDGQQRTTSFFLLCKALYIRLNETLNKLKDVTNASGKSVIDVLNEYINELAHLLCKSTKYVTLEKVELIDKINQQWTSRGDCILISNKSLNEEKKEAFTDIINFSTIDEIEKNEKDKYSVKLKKDYSQYLKNFLYFYKEIPVDSAEICQFAEFVLNACEVIVIKSWDSKQAINIFDSLNSKGQKLDESSIILSNFYKIVPNETKENFKKLWEIVALGVDCPNNGESIYKNKFLNISINDILMQYLYIYCANSGNLNYLKKSFRDFYLNNIEKNSIIETVQELVKLIKIWKQIEDLVEVKLLLKFNENAKYYLMVFLSRFKESEVVNNFDNIKRFIRILLRLFTILDITDAQYSNSKFRGFLNTREMFEKLANGSIDDLERCFNIHIQTNWVRSGNSANSIEMLFNQSDPKDSLVFLNEYLYSQLKNLNFDISENVNIEHIMPCSGKNIEVVWRKQGFSSDDKGKKDFIKLVEKLGNKILLEEKINKSIQDAWFEIKKKSKIKNRAGYVDSIYPLAISLTDYPKNDWKKKDINEATLKSCSRILDFIFNE